MKLLALPCWLAVPAREPAIWPWLLSSSFWPQDLPQCRGRWALPSLWLHIPGRLHKTHWHRSLICSLVLPKTQNHKGNHVTEMSLSQHKPMAAVTFQTQVLVWSCSSWWWKGPEQLEAVPRSQPQTCWHCSSPGLAISESLRLFLKEQETLMCFLSFKNGYSTPLVCQHYSKEL